MFMFEIMPMTVSNEAIPYMVMSSPLLLVAMVKWNNYIQGSYYHNFLQSQDLGICKVSTPSLAFFASLFAASFLSVFHWNSHCLYHSYHYLFSFICLFVFVLLLLSLVHSFA